MQREEIQQPERVSRPLTLGELVALLGLLATTFAVGITMGYLLAI